MRTHTTVRCPLKRVRLSDVPATVRVRACQQLRAYTTDDAQALLSAALFPSDDVYLLPAAAVEAVEATLKCPLALS